jgi:uncharacterized protein (DUF2141 family)
MKVEMPLQIVMMLLGFIPGRSAGDGLEVSGTVRFSETGTIHIMLFDEEQFEVPFTGIRRVVMTPSAEQGVGGTARFAFYGLPPGPYGLRAYQDLNGNGELDRGLFGPQEPWVMTWNNDRLRSYPSFEEVSFPLHGDLTSVEPLHAPVSLTVSRACLTSAIRVPSPFTGLRLRRRRLCPSELPTHLFLTKVHQQSALA